MSTDIELPQTLVTDSTAADHPPEPTVTVIEPVSGWQMINFGELWAFRELVYFLVWRDVKVRYKQTVLGAAWAIIQPAMLMVVFTVFLGMIAKVPAGDVPYPLFVYLGVLPWSFFSSSISHAGNSVVSSEGLVTKVYFPRLAIPIASVGACVVDFLLAFILLIGLMTFYGIVPGPRMLMIPVVFLIIAMTGLGIGTLLAALNVVYRDFRYVVGFMIQLWMFATPTVYMRPDLAPGGMHAILHLNPMTGLIAAFRNACLGRELNYAHLGLSALFAIVILIIGASYFRRLERRFADII